MFDPLTTTAVQLSALLADRIITSRDIVETYLESIERNNTNGTELNALISISPKHLLVAQADRLDVERKSGCIRSSLHGIPIILKDNIITSWELGLPTTVGAHVFRNSTSKRNAPIVETLLAAGLIIIGKGNLTEFCGIKSPAIMTGWSTVGGQTKSAYVKSEPDRTEGILGHTAPGGSSSGCAVGVAAGFAPLAIGSDTAGSLISPSNRAAICALRPSHGMVNCDMVFRLSSTFDVIGPMAKCVDDVHHLFNIMIGSSFSDPTRPNMSPRSDFESDILKIGFVDPRLWHLDDSICKQDEATKRQLEKDYTEAMLTLQRAGVDVKYPVELSQPTNLVYKGQPLIKTIAYHQFSSEIVDFCSHLEGCPVTTLSDTVLFNVHHARLTMPEPFSNDQAGLDDILKCEKDPFDIVTAVRRARSEAGPNTLDVVLRDNGIDVLAAPGDSAVVAYTAAAGYPQAVVPLNTLHNNGRPHGVSLVASKGQELMLFRAMGIFERHFERPVPDL